MRMVVSPQRVNFAMKEESLERRGQGQRRRQQFEESCQKEAGFGDLELARGIGSKTSRRRGQVMFLTVSILGVLITAIASWTWSRGHHLVLVSRQDESGWESRGQGEGQGERRKGQGEGRRQGGVLQMRQRGDRDRGFDAGKEDDFLPGAIDSCVHEDLVEFVGRNGGSVAGLGFGSGGTNRMPDRGEDREGRRLVTTRAFRDGDVLATVTHNLTMSIATALESHPISSVYQDLLMVSNTESAPEFPTFGTLDQDQEAVIPKPDIDISRIQIPIFDARNPKSKIQNPRSKIQGLRMHRHGRLSRHPFFSECACAARTRNPQPSRQLDAPKDSS